ncbi:MAG: hypothetical protein IIA70_09265, partial [Proteobacteria bacterium]|nr:hypothetical protein [Pseudomonadota bacterium]
MARKPKAKFEITAENKTGRAFRQVNSDLSRLAGGVKSVLGPLAILAGTTALVNFGRNALKSADAIGKFADRIGISTRALQEYRHAFKLAGVEQEETDKGLLTFSKRIGEARVGTGALVEILRRLNPELLQLIINSRSEGEALEIIFKGMGKATTASEKNAIANAALGRAGVKMTAAFKNGANAFFETARAASRLGLVIEDKLIRNAEKLNDDFTTATGIIGTQLQAAFLKLAPAISTATTEFTEFLGVLGKLKRLHIGPDFESTSSITSFLEEEIERLKTFRDTGLEGGSFSLFGFDFKEKTKEEIKAARQEVQFEIEALQQILENVRKSAA